MMIISVLFVIAVHEIGHILAIFATRAGRVQGMVVSLKGIGVKWEPYDNDPMKRSIVSFAGPAINLVLAVFFYAAGLELMVLTNFVFGLVNLLPIPGADGKRAVSSLKEVV